MNFGRLLSLDPPWTIPDLREKILGIASRHEQLKVSFYQLNSQIRDSLREAEDVFTSLALPLMKLVGLKTVEMAAEGRFSTIVKDAYRSDPQGCRMSKSRTEALVMPVSPIQKSDSCSDNLEEENRATRVGKELREKQKLQLMQLVHLLKQIETQVNSSQNDILHALNDHQVCIKRFFLKAVTHVSAIHQSGRDNGMSLMMLKLLKATYNHVGEALGSVEVGVDNLISELAGKMCNPMVEYVNDLKGELITGTCTRLLNAVEEMSGALKVRRLELQEARNRAILAESSRLELLRKLKESEDMVRKLRTYDGFLLQANKKRKDNLVHQKLLSVVAEVEDQAKDERLLWELLRNKRKHQIPESPLGPKQLLGIEADNNNSKSTSIITSINGRHSKRSQRKGLAPQTPCTIPRLPLGSSPSVNTQKVLSRKRITT